MIATCQNCKNVANIPEDKIPQCGHEIRWNCSKCEGSSFIKKVNGGFSVRFDQFSLMLKEMTLCTIKANATESENNADELWNDCLGRI